MRYIDDCFCIWRHGADELTSYFEYVDTVHATIKFTIERSGAPGHKGQIPFPDILLNVRSGGRYSTQPYIIPVAASIILPFDSAQPVRMKKAVSKSQFFCALRVSSGPVSAKRGTSKIHALFRANGYPSRSRRYGR